MQIPVVLLAGIETAFNALFKLDSEALPRFAALEGKIICLHISGLELKLYFLPSANDIQVLGNYPQDAQVDATIHGAPMALMNLTTSSNAGETLLKSDVKIEGDMRTAETFSALLKAVDIDWEELFSHLVGDIVAHQAGQIIRSSAGWLSESATAMQLNTGEYLSEESRMTPAEAEVSYYLDQVDELRMDVDRLEARINQLKNRSQTHKN